MLPKVPCMASGPPQAQLPFASPPPAFSLPLTRWTLTRHLAGGPRAPAALPRASAQLSPLLVPFPLPLVTSHFFKTTQASPLQGRFVSLDQTGFHPRCSQSSDWQPAPDSSAPHSQIAAARGDRAERHACFSITWSCSAHSLQPTGGSWSHGPSQTGGLGRAVPPRAPRPAVSPPGPAPPSLPGIVTILVCWGCCNKIQQTG